jgi:glycosyltransferase involved in cell wall biosynthesis
VTSAAGVQSGWLPREPLVSILTPSFNQRAWLVDTLGSVASQTYPHLEHIVVDGGSTDGSVELLRAALPAGCWISEADSGQSEALNKALDRSGGEIIGWLNSDDAYLFDDVVESVVAYLHAHPDVDVAYGHAALVSEAGQLLQIMWTPPYSPGILQRFNCIVQPAAFMRRSVLEEGFLDESFHYTMDHELWLRLAASHSFGRIDQVLAIDRHQAERKGYARPDLAREEVMRLSEKYGIDVTRAGLAERKLRRIGYRFRGAPTAFRLRQDRKAFDWSLDGRAPLLTRQLVLKRRFMRAGKLSPA